MSEKNAHSLYELNEYIKRVVSLNFNETLWISCEISQANNSRGHYYLELVQKNEDSNEVIAQMSAVIWVKNFLFIKRKLGDVADLILVNGSQVLLKVKLDFNERYGLKLIVEDIDASYTIGQMEIARQKTLERLKKENLIHLNSQNDIPKVIQRVAVISSKTAAGYQDFIQHLTNNSYGYQYKTTLFQTAMQGLNTEKELLQSMNQILENKEHFDVVCIIRGGGSKLDLGSFDNYNIAVAIAQAELPVFCGIGHDIDQTIADIVAFYELKTPTAVADFLIEHNLHFESEIQYKAQNIGQLVQNQIFQYQQDLTRMDDMLKLLPKEMISRAQEQTKYLEIRLKDNFGRKQQEWKTYLNNAEKIIQLSDPKEILKKGYAMITVNDAIVTSAKKLKTGDQVALTLADGKRKATVL